MQDQPDAEFEIQLAAARVEAVLAKTIKALELLLNGPDSLNSHFARAVKTIVVDHSLPLQNRLRELHAALRNQYPDPDTRPQPPGSHAMLAEQVAGLTARYETHLRSHNFNLQRHSAPSVFYTITITSVITNAATRALNGEILSRDANDPTARAYRAALLQTAAEIPHRAEVVQKITDEGDATTDRMKRHLTLAQEAEADTLRLFELHSAARS